MSLVLCDYESYAPPLHALINGPFRSSADLQKLERLVRAFVLHDEMHLHFSGTRETNNPRLVGIFESLGLLEEEAPRSVYKSSSFFVSPPIPSGLLPGVDPSNGKQGKFRDYYHPGDFSTDQTQLVLNAVLARGGSLLLEEGLERSVVGSATHYPEALFGKLDEDWKQFASSSHLNGFNFAVPPVLSIVLNRCATREAIPRVLIDLRAEWAQARSQTWDLLAEMRNARTLKRALDIKRELESASELFRYQGEDPDDRPIRVFWELLGAAGAGAAVAAASAGRPLTGALVGAIAYAGRSVPQLAHEIGPALYGRGAFDLARRVRRNTALVEGDVLSRLISATELKALRA